MHDATLTQSTPQSVSHKIAGAILSLMILGLLTVGIARHVGNLSCSGDPVSEVSLPAATTK